MINLKLAAFIISTLGQMVLKNMLVTFSASLKLHLESSDQPNLTTKGNECHIKP